ncbi:hypothetical protein ACVU7I_01415 [Patulibacter sp. S7RM1-6]
MRPGHTDGDDTSLPESGHRDPDTEPERPVRPHRPRRLVGVAVALLAVVLLVVLAVVPMVRQGTTKTASLLTSNTKVDVSQTAEVLRPGQQRCVRRLRIPASQADLRTYPGYVSRTAPPLETTVRAHGRTVERRVVRDYASNLPIALPVAIATPTGGVTVCFRNRGDHAVSLAHARLPREGERRTPIRVDFWSRPQTLTKALPVALTRASLFKGDLVTRTVLVAVLLVALVAFVAGAAVAVRRDDREGTDA